MAKVNRVQRFKMKIPSCANLECNDECDPAKFHCGRVGEACRLHNRRDLESIAVTTAQRGGE